MNEPLKVLDLFSGIGGFSLGLERTGGFETVAFCEIEEFPRKVLAKHWPEVPQYEDVTKLTGDILRRDGISVDVITGGFPCQDISVAGKQAGIGEGTRSGLWSEIVRLIGELLPRYVIVENVAALLSGPSEQRGGWFGSILADLAQLGYDAEWQNIPAAVMGAPHRRERVWIVAYPECKGRQGFVTNNGLLGGEGETHPFSRYGSVERGRPVVSGSLPLRTGDGLPLALDRLRIKAAGNSIEPRVPEMIGRAILAQIHDQHKGRLVMT